MLRQADHELRQRVRDLLQSQYERQRLRGRTMNSTRPDRLAACTKLRIAARGPSSRKYHAADHQSIHRGESGDFGRRREARLEPSKK